MTKISQLKEMRTLIKTFIGTGDEDTLLLWMNESKGWLSGATVMDVIKKNEINRVLSHLKFELGLGHES